MSTRQPSSTDASTYTATCVWARPEATAPADFRAGRYSRRHTLRFDGGAEISGSSSPHHVPLPWSDDTAVDPEEAFVAALSSCHMLFFLSFAARDGFIVDAYRDAAEGICERGADGREQMTVVTLRPRATFSGERLPTREQVERLHHRSHDACYIANSVTTDVRIEPQG